MLIVTHFLWRQINYKILRIGRLSYWIQLWKRSKSRVPSNNFIAGFWLWQDAILSASRVTKWTLESTRTFSNRFPNIVSGESNFLKVCNRVTGSKSNARTFDIQVLQEEPYQVNQNFESYFKEVDSLNEQINSLKREISKIKRRREFFLNFAEDPVGFIYAMLDSQVKDFKVKKIEFYFTKWNIFFTF